MHCLRLGAETRAGRRGHCVDLVEVGIEAGAKPKEAERAITRAVGGPAAVRRARRWPEESKVGGHAVWLAGEAVPVRRPGRGDGVVDSGFGDREGDAPVLREQLGTTWRRGAGEGSFGAGIDAFVASHPCVAGKPVERYTAAAGVKRREAQADGAKQGDAG